MSDERKTFPAWQYVAPHWASDPVPGHATDIAESDDPRLDLNLQLLARVLDTMPPIAFLGAGWSKALGYPSWIELVAGGGRNSFEEQVADTLSKCNVPSSDVARTTSSLRDSVRLLTSKHVLVDPPAVLEVMQSEIEHVLAQNGGLDPRRRSRTELRSFIGRRFRRAQTAARRRDFNPYVALQRSMPVIRRFVTTNFDGELKRALAQVYGADWLRRRRELLFSQTAPDQIALLSIPWVGHVNNGMALYCHGQSLVDAVDYKRSTDIDDLVITEADYKRWYLDSRTDARCFRDAFQVLLQSNPLLIAGYSLSDPDLVRSFRQLTIMKADHPRNVFLLLDVGPYFDQAARVEPDDPALQTRLVSLRLRADQSKFGVIILPFMAKSSPRHKGTSLKDALDTLGDEVRGKHRQWREQPVPRLLTPRAAYRLVLDVPAPDVQDWVLDMITKKLKHHTVVSLCGSLASAKYRKACEYAHVADSKYQVLVFSAHGNEDVYFYFRRVAEAVIHCLLEDMFIGDQLQRERTRWVDLLKKRDLMSLLRDALWWASGVRRGGQRGKPLLLIISGFDRFFDEPGPNDSAVRPRNQLAADLVKLIVRWQKAPVGGERHHSRILLTTSRILAPLTEDATVQLAQGTNLVRVPFTAQQLGLETNVFDQIAALLPNQPAAIPLASAFIRSSLLPSTMDERAAKLIRHIRAAPIERGLRVIRSVINALDAEPSPYCAAASREFFATEPAHRQLLQRLSCFNRPFQLTVVRECFAELVVSRHSTGFDEAWTATEAARLTDLLLDLHLLERVTRQRRGHVDAPEDAHYVVHPLVRRYCRMMFAHGSHASVRAFGLDSALSRGPFDDPGRDARLVYELFTHFERAARTAIRQLPHRSTGEDESDEVLKRPRRLTRAAFEVIRSNLSANTVCRSGRTFPDYLSVCARCYDLVKNYAVRTGALWSESAGYSAWIEANRKTKMPLTAEEIIWLLNEMGLAYYWIGGLRDAVTVWTTALEWQRKIAEYYPEQGVMYSASLHGNLGTASLIMGRLREAVEYFTRARDAAHEAGNYDLQCRMDGFMARVENLRGNLKSAAASYDAVIHTLGKLRNLRAQSYFMRYRGLLNARLNRDRPDEDVQLSLTIAASEKHPDVVGDARYFLGRVYLEQNKASAALGEFRAALKTARSYRMGLLETNALVGIARAELLLGDHHAALETAFGALRRANECVWALRQVESFNVIGRAYLELGHTDVGHQYVVHATTLAREHEFYRHADEMEKALVAFQAGDSVDQRSG